MDKEIKVLIKTNENNEVIEITSSVFKTNIDDYIEIDSGFGDKYAHSQNNYLQKPITDIYGRYNYIYTNSVLSEVEHEEYIMQENTDDDTQTILNSLLEVE